MRTSRILGFFMIAPAVIMILLFFLMPAVLTGVFSMTSMSTATGISGGAWQVTQGTVNRLKNDMPDFAAAIAAPRFVIDEDGLNALQGLGLKSVYASELAGWHKGEIFTARRDVERAIKDLKARPSTREVKQIADVFNRSVLDIRFETRDAFLRALAKLGFTLNDLEQEKVAAAAYTGWIWTTENFAFMASSSDIARIFANTAFYVATTLLLFNVGYALLLAVSTHYMPAFTASIFRAIWLLPRITPVAIYVLLWKWLTWDSGFLSLMAQQFGYPAKNYLLDSATNAWFFVVLINGFVGASMGMLVFSSAIRAIPESQFHASEVDGASRWQQIRHIILPHLRWPILFVTSYQTLSLLASFNEILLTTNGGPGGATEVWSLAAYHTALKNYTGNLEYGLGAAMALVLVSIGIVLSLIYLRVFRYDTLITKPLIED